MDTRTKEALRYLGYKQRLIENRLYNRKDSSGKIYPKTEYEVEEEILHLVKEAFAEIEEDADFRILSKRFDLQLKKFPSLSFGNLEISSEKLYNHLKDCKEVVLLACTLGTGVDILIKKSSVKDMAYGTIMQACGAAFIEDKLDKWNEGLEKEEKTKGNTLKFRFSPGYGDLSLSIQGDVLRLLDAPKRIGLTVSDGGLMTPVKSVTAIIGVKQN
jgi:hypothetical protein